LAYFQGREVLMIAVNELIQQAYESINMTGMGEAVGDYADDNLPIVGVNELNRLITQLNNEGFLAMAQKCVDCPNASTIYFRKLIDGEIPQPGTVDMEAPEKVVSVARRLGNRYIVLNNSNLVQQAWKNTYTTARTWTYNTELETTPDDHVPDNRVVGILTLDGQPRGAVRVWYNSKLPKYKLDETVYLSDLYNELLLSGLAWRLANYFELSDEKKQSTLRDFDAAKSLIKRNNVTQRMLVNSNIGSDWRDPYFNGLNGEGM